MDPCQSTAKVPWGFQDWFTSALPKAYRQCLAQQDRHGSMSIIPDNVLHSVETTCIIHQAYTRTGPTARGGAIATSAALKPSLKRAAAPSRDNASAKRDPTRRKRHWSTRDSAFYTTGSRMIVFGTNPIRSQHPRPNMYSYVDQTPQTSTKMFSGFRT